MDINKLIQKIAKEKFSGHGLKQKGRSRLWYFPGHYYLIVVEFQPSAWDKGTYLNVGLDFNWYPKNYFAFEFGHRLSEFKPSTDESEFQKEVERLCDFAIEKVNEYKAIFGDSKTAVDKLLKLHKDKTNDWEKFHIGVLMAFNGQKEKSIALLKKASSGDFEFDWQQERANIAKDYIAALENGTFATKVEEVIRQAKELKNIV